jgi:hypothetical protein
MKCASSGSMGWNLVFWTLGAVAASCGPTSILMDDGTTGGAPTAVGTGSRAGGGQGVGGATPTEAGADAPTPDLGCPTVCPANMPGCTCLKDINDCYRVLRCTPPAAPCGESAVLCGDGSMWCDFHSACDLAKSDCREFCNLAPSGAGGAGSAGGGSAGAAMAGAGGSAAADPGCAALPDEIGTPVEIVVNNARSAPIYVGSRETLCNLKREFSIRDSANVELPIETDSCFTCADLAASGPCVYSCGRSPLYRVLPGASITLRWNGTYFVTQQLTTSCLNRWPVPSGTCPQEKAAPAGSYSLSVTASAEVGCGFSDPGCSCVVADTCPYPGAVAAYGIGDAYQASAEVQVPGTTSATVTFAE